MLFIKDIKMGKYDLLDYDVHVSQSYCFDLGNYTKSSEYSTTKQLFINNYLNSNGESRIPKIIHQIWLGSPIPEKFAKLAESWKKFHPDWEYKLWTDADIPNLHLQHEDKFYLTHNYGQKSDILRHELLFKFGGLYVDTDFECLKPFDDLMYLTFFTSSGYSPIMELYPGLMAGVPENIISKEYIDHLDKMDCRTWKGMFNTTGPYYFTRCFFNVVKADMEGYVAFPPKFFYPWPNNDMNCKDPYKYVKSYSYGIHHWAVSWTKGRQLGKR